MTSAYAHVEHPDYMQNTLDMVACAFPNGIPEKYYLPLLKALAQTMSFRNLARFMSPIVNKPEYVISNEAIMAFNLADNTQAYLEVLERLAECGYSEWLLDI